MWILSADNSLLDGKRIWLRPGTSYLFGRFSGKIDGVRVRYVPDEGSVSRKHLFLTVADVKPGSSTSIYEKAAITATDSSKAGTVINGQILNEKKGDGSERALDGNQYTIKLGQASFLLHLEWKPVVLSFTNIGKIAKSKGTALADEKKKLESADVKLSTEYLTNETTHVVAKKRNTAAGLQALVQARWLITDSFVSALAETVKPQGHDENGSPGPSLLEEDIDANWPKEKDYIVPTGGEPVSRPNGYLKPDETRAEVFSPYTFVFLSQSQFDSLMPVITGGGGKALLFEFKEDETTTEDLVNYCKELAGKKNHRNFVLSREPGPGGIVVVRIMGDSREGPFKEVIEGFYEALDQRSIEQSELLDAILTKDCSNFRKPHGRATQLSMADDQDTASSNTRRLAPTRSQEASARSSPSAETRRGTRSTQKVPTTEKEPEETASEQPAIRRRRKIITQPKFNFDDDFDPSQIIKADEDEEHEPGTSQAPSLQSMDVDEPSQVGTQRSTRKRPAPDETAQDAESEQQFLDRLLPGIAAAKRRKTEALKKGDAAPKKATPTPEPEVEIKDEKPVKRGAKTKISDVAIKAKVEARRKAEDEARQKDDEAIEEMRNADLTEELKNYEAPVELFDVPLRPRPQPTTVTNPEWKDRPNYKKFQSNKNKNRANAETQGRAETQRVIISLEPVPNKGHGLGDEYWLDTEDLRRSKKSQSKSQSQTQRSAASASRPSQSQSGIPAPRQALTNDEGEPLEDDQHAFRRRVERSREIDAANEVADDVFDDDTTQTTRATPSQRKTAASGKRPAAQAKLTDSAPPAKRQATQRSTAASSRAPPPIMVDDESDDDPTAFRRRRR
ncbi:hypothetical protein CLAFUW4_02319 [Fulvia fulva]|uniref:FHA domain-containing protein n=1 Tax=Passalora fulva TaxID=5499 RepID=A0A9Q8L6G8_PASFU|nr:uncharacterized protein CLAFUR5_02308 [Fulvia fulva]KAK4635345.1 hypothetical protein CLAFUR4_02314 [Fulvia fulva]KAK4638139.1 hypothetical protein CLAFUR0_02318 [Fulvia fulva]UJO11765.1 hypothetical protein CLAFUR5_02308 [Fulvia fulva]WPV09071.1 hypothetical protein CLAFUW4_02319 [Fulvia fulva]WPV23265.1 hypothetical protein CLAFUW7_02319 [Fulvia fulva]